MPHNFPQSPDAVEETKLGYNPEGKSIYDYPKLHEMDHIPENAL